MDVENTEAKRSHWWEDKSKVKRTIAGVFEGGGAKGVLYAGALRTVLKKQCWFEAVAGASAGAITATLIAAGLNVDQIEAEMDHALEAPHKPRLLNGVLRVREGNSFLYQEKLLEWLTGLLERQIMDLCGKQVSGHVSFEQLYEATEGKYANLVEKAGEGIRPRTAHSRSGMAPFKARLSFGRCR